MHWIFVFIQVCSRRESAIFNSCIFIISDECKCHSSLQRYYPNSSIEACVLLLNSCISISIVQYDAYDVLISLITNKINNDNRSKVISLVVTVGLLGCLIKLVPLSV